MAGTLFGLGLSQQHDVNGRPMSGCLLYLYDASTTTPAVAYRSPALAPGQELTWPIVADSMGRIPAFWLPDGAYRARLTDEAGIVQFDEQSILAVGSGSGDVFVSSTPPEATLTTGMVMWIPGDLTKTGWVRCNGKTIGNTASGGSELANDVTAHALYLYLYSSFDNAICPVTPSRTGNAQADFDNGRPLTLLDMRARTAFGLDTMGNVSSGWMGGISFGAGNAVTPGSMGGATFVQIATANLPPYTPAGTVSKPTITTKVRVRNDTLGAGVVPFATTVASSTGADVIDSSVLTSTPAFTGTAQGGTSQALQTIPTFTLGSWFMRL